MNFIKIAQLLRVVSIQVQNIGLWGYPSPPADLTHLQYQPIPRQNTHFGFCFIKIGQDLLKLSWGQIWDTGYSVQRTAYRLTMTPPEID